MSARTRSFCAGLLLTLLLALGAVALPATRTGLFARALKTHAAVLPQAELDAFAEETMRYLRGEKPAWEPQASLPVSEAFRSHMQTVRGWVAALPWVLAAGLALCALCLARGLHLRAFLGGMAAVGALAAAVGLWAAVDFNSLWMTLHRLFIPDGIFPAGEPVMRLFPPELFLSYAGPVAAVFALLAGLVFLWLYTRKRKGKVL